MKDFDFDELDRAVSSVLTKKQADQASTPPPADDQSAADVPQGDSQPADSVSDDAQSQPADDVQPVQDDTQQPQDGVHVQVVDSSAAPADESTDDVSDQPQRVNVFEAPAEENDEPDEHNDAPVPAYEAPEANDGENVYNDTPHDETPSEQSVETEATEQPEDDRPVEKAEVTPHKRGRFMDMVHPSADMGAGHKPIGPRGGMTLTPSSDFHVDASPVESSMSVGAETPAESHDEISTAPHDVPDTLPEENDETVAQPASDEAPEEISDAAIAPEPSPVAETADEPDDEAEQTDKPDTDDAHSEPTTPFIPNASVEKRPLNSLTEPADDHLAEAAAPAVAGAAVTGTSPLPKEFSQEIMSVEANETIADTTSGLLEEGGDEPSESEKAAPATAPATGTSSESPQTQSGTPYIAPQYKTTEPALDQEAHPVFDTSTYHQPLAAHDTHASSSKMMWILIVAALFLIGAALGVLYFLYGQR